MSAVRSIRAAFVFLTRIPVGGFPYPEHAWRWAPAWFPLVGVIVGAGSGVAHWAALHIDATVASVIALIVSVLLTGAFHEDGLADTADAMGGAHGGKQLLEILKDSRIGTYGAVALVLSLGLRVSCLTALAGAALPALVICHTVARTFPVWMIATMSYVTGDRAKGSAISQAGTAQAVVASVVCGSVLTVAVWRGWFSLAALGASLGVTAVMALLLGLWFRRRAGGITGDFLGATEQVGECAVLLTLLAFATQGG